MDRPFSNDLPQSKRFEFQTELGRGGMGIVFRAFDSVRGDIVAVKTVRNFDGADIYRMKNEFRSLCDVLHPNLVKLHELFVEDECWFFSMEYVDGLSFVDYVLQGPSNAAQSYVFDESNESDPGHSNRAVETEYERTTSIDEPIVHDMLQKLKEGVDDQNLQAVNETGTPSNQLTGEQEERLFHALRQLAKGLNALHQSGRIHRDIKPSNVMVTNDGRVVILDFGLAFNLFQRDQDQTLKDHVVGTVAYMSPEQAANQDVTPASDWYSVGVILYYLLTGNHPFEGTYLEVLLNKQRDEIKLPLSVKEHAPAQLVDLCEELLERDPKSRPKGASFLERLGNPTSGLESLVSVEVASPFIGRDKELRLIRESLNDVKNGQTVVLNLYGQSGLGKSAFLEQFFEELSRESNTVLLAGKCYERESVPYKAVDSLIDSLSHYLVNISDSEAAGLIPRDVSALARLFPVLQRVEAVTNAPQRRMATPDQQELRGRAFQALRELLARLGDRKILVLTIDDLQWGDLDSIALLAELIRSEDPPTMLFLASFRSEDAGASHIINGFRELQRETSESVDIRELALEPLSSSHSAELAKQLFASLGIPDIEEALCRQVASESGGHPYFIDALVRRLVTGGSNRELEGDSRISLDEVLWDRVNQLADGARRLLNLVAIAGIPLGISDLLGRGESRSNQMDLIELLRLSRLVRITGQDSADTRIDTYHDRIRETIVSHLDSEERRKLHGILADTYRVNESCDTATLAQHYLSSGEQALAAKQFAIAAVEASNALAFDRAASLFESAVEHHAGSEEEMRRLRSQLALALANAGRGPESAQQYIEAMDGANAAESLECRRQAAMQYLISGRIDDGIDALQSVVKSAGLKYPRSPIHALVSVLWHRALLRLRSTKFHSKDESQNSAEEIALADICWTASIGLSIVDTIRGADFQARGFLRALKMGDPFRVSRSMSFEAAHMSIKGKTVIARSTVLMDRAKELAELAESAYAKGLAQAMEGLIQFFQGKWRLAIEFCDLAEMQFRNECTGAAWEINTAQTFSLWSLFYSGDIAELSRRLPGFLAEALDRGNLYSLNNLSTFARPLSALAADEPDKAYRQLDEVMSQWSNQGFHVQHLNGLFGRTHIDIYQGEGLKSFNRLQSQWPDIKRSLILRVQQVRIIFTHLQARTAFASLNQGLELRQVIRHARKAAKQLNREKASWAKPLAKLIEGTIQHQLGNKTESESLLQKALDEFEQHDMMLFANSTRYCLGDSKSGPQGQAMIDESLAWMKSQNILNPKRMVALHVPGFW